MKLRTCNLKRAATDWRRLRVLTLLNAEHWTYAQRLWVFAEIFKLVPNAERCTYAQRLRVFFTTFTGTLRKRPGLTGFIPWVWLVSW